MTKQEFFEAYREQYEDITATLDYTTGIDPDMLNNQPALILVNGKPTDVIVRNINIVDKTLSVVNHTPLSSSATTISYISEWIFMKLFQKGSLYSGMYTNAARKSSCDCGAAHTSNKNWHMTFCPLSGVRR